MISVQHLFKQFGDIPAVNDVSFEVQEGEIFVLLGTSGSGKTSILRMINRLIEPGSGKIFIHKKNVLHYAPETLRRSIGYVLQGYGLFPHYTVAENIAIVPKLLNWPPAKIAGRVTALLNKLQMPAGQYRNAWPDELSGGQKQRVGLARALAADPPILLMDEPFGALDPLTRTEVRKAFKSLDELQKKTTILVTHDVQEAFELADKICLVDKGSVVQMGTPQDLIFKPANEFVKHFFAHRGLQLELLSVSMANIWDELPSSPQGDSCSLKSYQNLWEAMEALTRCEEPVTVFDEESGERKMLKYSNLQAAIKKRKQHS